MPRRHLLGAIAAITCLATLTVASLNTHPDTTNPTSSTHSATSSTDGSPTHPPVDPTEQARIDTVVACAKTLPARDVGVHDATCMPDTIANLLTTSTMGDTQDTLAAATTVYPPLELACHTSAMQAAKTTHQKIEDLHQLTANACKGGLGRGAVAAWVTEGADQNRLTTAVHNCETTSAKLDTFQREETRDRCASAIGIGLWDAHQDPTLCGLFNTPRPHGCAGAFLQEMFQPVGGPVKPRTSVDAVEDWCRHWPSELDVTDCYAGVVLAVAYDYTSTMYQVRTGTATDQDAYNALTTAIERCRNLDPGGTCEASLIRRLPRARGDVPGAPLTHCQAFAEHLQAHCRTQLADDPLRPTSPAA